MNNSSPVAANEASLSFIEPHNGVNNPSSVEAHFSAFDEQEDEEYCGDEHEDDDDAIDLDGEARCSL